MKVNINKKESNLLYDILSDYIKGAYDCMYDDDEEFNQGIQNEIDQVESLMEKLGFEV